MTPSIDLRVATLIRAVEDVIAPAIDQTNHLAKEQTALLVGQLKLLAAQWNRAADYAAVCRADLAGSLGGLRVEGAEQTQRAYAAVAGALSAPPGPDAEADYKALMAWCARRTGMDHQNSAKNCGRDYWHSAPGRRCGTDPGSHSAALTCAHRN